MDNFKILKPTDIICSLLFHKVYNKQISFSKVEVYKKSENICWHLEK